jgi:RNA polymerase sigma factor (sigma-70 family)
MAVRNLIPHLFRTEYSKIIAVLCKHFGFEHLEVAEDIASDTFLTALNTWPYHGVPENPTAWLYTVAKNKAKNFSERNRTFTQKVAPVYLNSVAHSVENEFEIDISPANIFDSQIRMLFSICHPKLSSEAQVGLALRLLCGFGIDEIATAFLSNRETITKRLYRAKEKIREENITFEFPTTDEIPLRLKPVLATLYLLFNEGYYSESNDAIVREELCLEAMRLVNLLTEHPDTDTSEVNALLSLMCFHASRLKARKNPSGGIVLYDDQDESLWDRSLIAKGAELLQKAAVGQTLSKYHIEAQIGYCHTQRADPFKWENILYLHNHLLMIEYSPVAALNRTFALSRVKGAKAAIDEAEKLQLTNNHFYYLLLAELYKESDLFKTRELLERAYELARTSTEKAFIKRKIELLL